MHSVEYRRIFKLAYHRFNLSLTHQADDVSALLTAAMPPSALPSCYKPQVLNGVRSPGATGDALSSSPSSPSSLSAASSLDNLSGSFSELSSVVSSSGTEGASSLEKKEGETFCKNNFLSCNVATYLSFRMLTSHYLTLNTTVNIRLISIAFKF